MTITRYKRTVEQDLACGLTPHHEGGQHFLNKYILNLFRAGSEEPAPPLDREEKEVLIFPGHCASCGASGETRMVVTGI